MDAPAVVARVCSGLRPDARLADPAVHRAEVVESVVECFAAVAHLWAALVSANLAAALRVAPAVVALGQPGLAQAKVQPVSQPRARSELQLALSDVPQLAPFAREPGLPAERVVVLGGQQQADGPSEQEHASAQFARAGALLVERQVAARIVQLAPEPQALAPQGRQRAARLRLVLVPLAPASLAAFGEPFPQRQSGWNSSASSFPSRQNPVAGR